MRVPILRALLRKELLRYRYNWGLLVLVIALLALSALLSVSARMKVLNLGGAPAELRGVGLLVPPDSPKAEQWAQALLSQQPPRPTEIIRGLRRPVVLPAETAAIELPPDAGPPVVVYWYEEANPEALLPVRDWFTRASAAHLGQSPAFEERSQRGVSPSGLERLPLIFTALVVFALYILSFNLALTSTGEEREKRVLLALLLTPATPREILQAKAIFYVGASLLVSGMIAAMYKPGLLLAPSFWVTVLCGALGYQALGTLALCLVRQQTTLSTVSILYMVATTLITFLGSFLPLFYAVKHLLLEEYLYRALHQLFSGKPAPGGWLNVAALAVGALLWSQLAGWVFRRRGLGLGGRG